VQLIDARDQWVRMDKSLGEKRRRISDEQIDEITRLHGAFSEGDLVKVLPNEAFGYRTITVDRPLRAYWTVADGTWEGVEEEKALAKLDDGAREAVIAALRAMPEQRWDTATDCAAALRRASNGRPAKPSAALIKALAARCIVRDQSLPEQRDAKGRIEWDLELRDTETVPLLEDVHDYLAREFVPHAPDARVEDPEGRIGYEIPFTRLFYKYTPPRPSEEIKAELREREARIRRLLEQVLV
jgi:type I restriction enzyme M protein